ncbi:MAG: S-layer homology domain-containing protein [Bifidobacteriaceae bacterium]|jgi:hypothetical protein|nr:S-layer homology domain-containing protein [Bifidobacteriaceae bacterium]
MKIKSIISVLVATLFLVVVVVFLATSFLQTDSNNQSKKNIEKQQLTDLKKQGLSESDKERLSEKGIGSLEDGTRSVIVSLKGVDENLKTNNLVEYQHQIAQSQKSLISQIKLSGINAKVSRQFKSVPAMSFLVDKPALNFLKKSSNVESVVDNKIIFQNQTNDSDTTPLDPNPIAVMGGSSALGFSLNSVQYNGNNYAVAVLDTGVDAAHPKLAGKVITEACFSYVVKSEKISSLCPGSTKTDDGLDFMTGPGSAAPCEDECDHGTHVASEAALSYQDINHSKNVYGSGSYAYDAFSKNLQSLAANGQGISGGARDAKIVAIQVFARFTEGSKTEIFSLTESYVAACDWIYTNANNESIFPKRVAAINLSLGSGGFSKKQCQTLEPETKSIFSLLNSQNIAVFVAAGNSWKDGEKNNVAAPACFAGAQAVAAAQNKGTAYSSYSQNGDATDLVSVGGDVILQRNPNGVFYCDATQTTSCSIEENTVVWGAYSLESGAYAWTLAQGTSMASPYAAGIYTSLKSYAPNASVADITNIMKITGFQLSDTRAGATTSLKPFIQGDKALQVLSNTGKKPIIYSFSPSKSNPEPNENIILRGRVSANSKCAIDNKVGVLHINADGTFQTNTPFLNDTFVLTCSNEENNAYISSVLDVKNYINYIITDVASDDQAKLDIEQMYINKFTTGCSFEIQGNDYITKYCPSDSVKREQMAAFLYNLKGKPDYTPPAVSPFSDLKPDNQFYKQIMWGVANGIWSGYEDKTFKGNKAITRGQFVSVLWRFYGSPEPILPSKSPFSDVKSSDSIYKAVIWAKNNSITTGYADGTFKPNKTCSRAQMAMFIIRAWQADLS